MRKIICNYFELIISFTISISITSASYKDESNKEIYADDLTLAFSIMEKQKRLSK